jgi:hypothetical protein
MIMIPPRTQERIAAGPAIVDALSAPNSQPEPMIDPTPAKSSAVRPMCRCRPLVSSSWLNASAV